MVCESEVLSRGDEFRCWRLEFPLFVGVTPRMGAPRLEGADQTRLIYKKTTEQ